MKVTDLDRDLSAIFVTSEDVDSTYLYRRMAEVAYAELRARPTDLVADIAAGVGRDARALAARGLRAVNVEPSATLTELEKLLAERESWTDLGSQVTRTRAWGESLPFRSASFAATLCKGSLDHFDDPGACIAEMARVTHSNGRVVLAVANMEALGLRLARLGRRRRARLEDAQRHHYDAPPDHLTRYDPALLREQASRSIEIESWVGVSLFWGNQRWGALLARMPATVVDWLLRGADAVARAFPSLADVIIVAGRPRRRS